MLTKLKILDIAKVKGKITGKELVKQFGVTRQYVNVLIRQLVETRELVKIGSTRNAFYVPPEFIRLHPTIIPSKFAKRYENKSLEEHRVSAELEERFQKLLSLKEHTKSIFDFAFSEMLNNAIEHSASRNIQIEVSLNEKELVFIIDDSGIGVFRNIMRKYGLKSETEAIQDLLKGKTTTIPRSHTGQGIFFTSKAADIFVLESFDKQLVIDNKIHDISIKNRSKPKRGTRVIFKIELNSNKHLSDVFKKFTNIAGDSDYGFDKTEVRIKLYMDSGINISRSQARRVLQGLDKFKVILLDFDKVPMIGQAFADEIYRVFKNKHPGIQFQESNMNDAVEFMVRRAKADAQ